MGTQEVLSVQCGIEVHSGEPVPKHLKATPSCDHAALIALNAREFAGSAVLCFPQATYLNVMGKLLDEELREYREDLLDGAGELLNMIFGYAKKVLNENGFSLQPAIPIVIRGREIELRTLPPGHEVTVPFLSVCGAFHVVLGVSG
jgi:chemotaxis protein CheX